MSSKFRKYLVLAIVSSFALALAASSASATTVVIRGGGVVRGTATTGSQLSLNTMGRTINCSTSTATATLIAAGTYTPVTLPFTVSTNLQPAFSSCTLTGGLRPTVACAATSVLQVTGLTDAARDRTAGQITGVSCTISLGATCSVRVTGRVTGSYSNATNQLTVDSPTGQSLVASGSTCASLPNDPSATFGATGGGPLIYNITPTTNILVTNP